MGKENSIKFTDVKMYMVFTLEGEVFDFDGADEYIKITSSSDMQRILEDYKDENWDKLFKSYDIDDIEYVKFIGIKFIAEDENGNKIWIGNDSRELYANMQFNINNLAEENAKKIQEIRRIIGSF